MAETPIKSQSVDNGSNALEPSRWRAFSDNYRAIAGQFLRFGVVGTAGFIVDTATVYTLRPLINIYAAGLCSYVVAATTTWLLNRSWTFRGRGGGAMHRQWALFLVANLFGFGLNRGTFSLLVALSPVCAANPVLAVAAGAGAGMVVNFIMMKKLVFR